MNFGFYYLAGLFVLSVGLASAFTIKDLTVRAENDKIFIGWGPLKCCLCCMQQVTVPYDNVEMYSEHQNQCWYPMLRFLNFHKIPKNDIKK